MTHVSILHFTGPPEIGGIESTMLAQVRVLGELGVRVRLIVGRGQPIVGAETVVIPQLDPTDLEVRGAVAALTGHFPDATHPLAQRIADALDAALSEGEACWVHNAFTVYLNPFLTVALKTLVPRRPDVRWLAWCEDLSGTSDFLPPLSMEDELTGRGALAGVRCVTVSETRRAELSAFLRIAAADIAVVPPPIDVESWLGLSEETRTLATEVGLMHAEPVVLVPAKLLPHKGLQRVCRVAACLRTVRDRPLLLVTGAWSPHEPGVSERLYRSLQELIRGEGLSDCVRLLSHAGGQFPSSRVVRELMMLCDLVFVPSVEEGFGIPLREAAMLRAPVLCSDIPVFNEVAGRAARYFRVAESDEALASAIIEMTSAPAQTARREAVRSMAAFRGQIETLLRETSSFGPPDYCGINV